MTSAKTFRCLAYCTASSFRINELIAYFKAQQIGFTHYKSSNMVHRPMKEGQADVFYFAFGVAICWDLTKDEEQIILAEVAPFMEGRLEMPEIEESTYVVGDAFKIVRDEIMLPSASPLTKAAISFGLAQTVKLAVFEKLILALIEKTRHIPESLAQKGRIGLSRKEINKTMGQIFIERNLVNLHTDVLDTPEFFWERSDLEPLYRMTMQDLDMAARIEVLNRRLGVVHELFEMLDNQLTHRHSIVLEGIIVGLIFIEILIVIAVDIFGWL